jgi:hypothetical protein
MTDHNTEAQGTAFTVSVDAAARFGVTTGISAWDRAKTIQVCMDPATARATCAARATSSRCAPAPAACCGASGRPRHRSTSPASPGSPPPA